MKAKSMVMFIFVVFAGYLSAKENLAILPFIGGQNNEGETIAELFSFDSRILEFFNPIPRTSINRAIDSEQWFQMNSGMTDADTIVSIGKQLGARYVVAGNITSVGNNKLLVISIMDIRNLQQIAGDLQTYNRIEEIREKLPNMAVNIVQATGKDTSSLQKLAIVPVQLYDGADKKVADTLAQLLAIYLIRSEKYAVYPRTESLDKIIDEHNLQLSGITDDSNVIGIGYGENPNIVLSVAARKLGNTNMFNAVIIDLLTGAQLNGHSVDYQNISDGISSMEIIAAHFTLSEAELTEMIDQRKKQEDKRESSRRLEEYIESSRFTRDSVFIFHPAILDSYNWGDIVPIFSIFGTSYLTYSSDNVMGFSSEPLKFDYSFFPFTTVGFGLGFGVSDFNSPEWNWIGIKPYVGFKLPIVHGDNGVFFLSGTGFIETGYSDWGSLLTNTKQKGFALNPGFESVLGFRSKDWRNDWSLEFSYGITWYPDNISKQSIGIAVKLISGWSWLRYLLFDN